MCKNAMYTSSTHRSLISFQDLRGHGIHVLTALRNGEETLELWQGQSCLATIVCEAGGLYEMEISSLSLLNGLKTMQPAGSAFSVTFPAKTILWHGRMGHLGTTMFKRMLPLLTRHEVCTSDANKAGACDACSQGKLIQRPSRWKLPTELPPKL